MARKRSAVTLPLWGTADVAEPATGLLSVPTQFKILYDLSGGWVEFVKALAMKIALLKASTISVAVLLACGFAVEAAEIRLLSEAPMRRAYEQLIPEFERTSGHKVIAQFDLGSVLIRKIDAGEPFDVIILAPDVQPLINQGKVSASSRTVLGRTGVGVAIPQGSPKPDISSSEAFKRTLLEAKAIATSGEGASGRYVLTLLDRLGIAEQVKPKIKSGGPGSAAQFVARREVDFAVIGLPPVVGVAGVEWIGWIPSELQNWVLFTGGVSVTAKEAEAGRALLLFLSTPAAVAVFKANGFEPNAP